MSTCNCFGLLPCPSPSPRAVRELTPRPGRLERPSLRMVGAAVTVVPLCTPSPTRHEDGIPSSVRWCSGRQPARGVVGEHDQRTAWARLVDVRDGLRRQLEVRRQEDAAARPYPGRGSRFAAAGAGTDLCPRALVNSMVWSDVTRRRRRVQRVQRVLEAEPVPGATDRQRDSSRPNSARIRATAPRRFPYYDNFSPYRSKNCL